MPRKSPLEKFVKKATSDLEKRGKRLIKDTAEDVAPSWLKPVVGTFLGSEVNQIEAKYRDRLAKQLKGITEVQTPNGRIDILTSKEIIEVKCVKKWKHALGQIIAYSPYYPHHKKRIHLYGQLPEKRLKEIKKHCRQQDVKVTWEE